MRQIRVLRFVRLLRVVQELRSMIYSIAVSLKSLGWALVILFGIMYSVAVVFITCVGETGMQHPEVMSDAGVTLYYSSLLNTMLCLFQSITGGIDWRDALTPLMVNIHSAMAIPFAFYIFFTVCAMLNVISGVFVESALQTAKVTNEDQVYQHVTKMLVGALKDPSADVITYEEFNAALSGLDMQAFLMHMHIEMPEAHGLFLMLDTADAGEVFLEEIIMRLVKINAPAKGTDLATVTHFNQRAATWWHERFCSIDSRFDDMCSLISNRGRFAASSFEGAANSSASPVEAEYKSESQPANVEQKGRCTETLVFAAQAEKESRKRVSAKFLGGCATWSELKRWRNRTSTTTAVEDTVTKSYMSDNSLARRAALHNVSCDDLEGEKSWGGAARIRFAKWKSANFATSAEPLCEAGGRGPATLTEVSQTQPNPTLDSDEKAVVKRCPNCNNIYAAEAVFCTRCGVPMARAPDVESL